MAGEYGYQVIVIEKKKIHDVIVSSTYIRMLISEGKMEEAETFLGRPYFLSGHVVHGRELGRTIQVPTANLLPKHGKIYPVTGVYASRIHLEDGRGLLWDHEYRRQSDGEYRSQGNDRDAYL